MESLFKRGAEMEDTNELDDTPSPVLPGCSIFADAEDCTVNDECDTGNCVSDSA